MASSLRNIFSAAPVIVRAPLAGAWSASKVGAISLTTVFTIANFSFGVYEVAETHLHIIDLLLGVVVGGALIFVFSLLLSILITVPVSSVIAMCAYPFLRIVRAADNWTFGIAGFLVGAIVWSVIWWNGPPGNLYFGSWMSVFVIGGLAGCAGGFGFAEQLRRAN